MKFKVGDRVKVNKKKYSYLGEYKNGVIKKIRTGEFPIDVEWDAYENGYKPFAEYAEDELLNNNSDIIRERLGVK